ncbi:hypothetical protein ABDX87_21615 [Pseudomonas abietaniphila]|uniref:hypothetical protein n=1 Tax=Pseudomonas abietaniphila TaxID=89065 RepID=UPI00321702A9
MANNTKADLLQWLAGGTRTFGWDAVIAYGRKEANALLRKQFIGRFAEATTFPPMQGVIETGQLTKTLRNVQLGPPLLSFEASSLDESRARLSLRIVAGQVVTEGEGGVVQKIQELVPAFSPELFMNVDLNKTDGGSTSAGEFYLDLNDAYDFTTSLFDADDDAGQVQAGVFFRERFAELPEARRFTLGTIARGDGSFAVDRFEVRTQMAPGANVRSAANFGDGAVLMFIKFAGGKPGTMPTPEVFRYLIPEDGFGATLLLSASSLLTQLGESIGTYLGEGVSFQVTALQNALVSAKASGDWSPVYLDPYSAGWQSGPACSTSNVYDYRQSFSVSSMTLSINGEKLVLAWDEKHQRPWYCFGMSWPCSQPASVFSETTSNSGNYWVDLAVTCKFVVRLNSAREAIVFEQSSYASSVSCSDMHAPSPLSNAQVESHFQAGIASKVKEKFESIPDMTLPIGALSGLLFADANSVRLKEAAAPQDLVCFGDIDSNAETPILSPDDSVLGANGVQNLTCNVPVAQWTLRDGDGNDDLKTVGSITSGRYQAPDMSDSREMSRRIVVTAHGVSGGQAHALITVLKTPLMVDPVFQVVSPADRCEILAGALNTADVDARLIAQWPEIAPSLAPVPNKPGAYVFEPGKSDKVHSLSLDRVEFTSKHHAGAVSSSYVLTQWRKDTATIIIDPEWAGPSTQVKLLLLAENDDWELVPYDGADWTLFAGDGSVDASGIYTYPERPQSGFAVVQAMLDDDGYELRSHLVIPSLAKVSASTSKYPTELRMLAIGTGGIVLRWRKPGAADTPTYSVLRDDKWIHSGWNPGAFLFPLAFEAGRHYQITVRATYKDDPQSYDCGPITVTVPLP